MYVKLSDYVIDFLQKEGISHVFEVCGGSITNFLDSLYGRIDIRAVSMHHEQAAAFAAEGYSRTGGNLGVAMATSGPGATNLITGIGSAFFDSIPCLFITGQVNTREFKFNRPVRQVGFQETDIVTIVKPIVKDAYIITKPDKIRYFLERSVYTARSGRPGPVLLDIPMNIQSAMIDPKRLEPFIPKISASSSPGKESVRKIVKLLASSTRPVILAGGGVRLAGAQDALLKFLGYTKIPLVCSLMGLDACPYNHPSFVGMIGTYGNRYANLAIANADLILALGTRFDTRQTGTKPHTFARGARIVHVDIDPLEIGNKIVPDLSVCSDIKDFLDILNRHVKQYDRSKIADWRNVVHEYKIKYAHSINISKEHINPNILMERLSEVLSDNAIICVDVGQHQMWAGQSLKIRKEQRFITEGGMASMGSSLPAAIGASFAKPKNPIIVITGDGGFQVNIQELQTIYHHRLPIKIILLNNGGYGMIRQFQKQYFGGRFQSTVVGYSQPEFQSVVSSYGLPVIKVSEYRDLDKTLGRFLKIIGPAFLEVSIRKDELVTPKLSVDHPIEDQDPLLPSDELKSNMFVPLLSKAIKNELRKKT